MTVSLSLRRPAPLRVARRTIGESLYLLTGPVVAGAGLILVLPCLVAGTLGAALPGGPRLLAGALGPARWLARVERWRISRVRPGADLGPGTAGPGLWLDVAHAIAIFPVALVTAVITGVWWFIALGAGSAPLRDQFTTAGKLRPTTLDLGGAAWHLNLSLGLTTPAVRYAFGLALGLTLLLTLPLLTRALVAVQTGLGQALLSDASALQRRIRGLEQERDTARAQTLAAVTAEAAALRRLERDIHDGPQQQLVRLGLELGRAQRHFDQRPEAARQALADALTAAQEALDELRALSRGIAPPVLADRGLAAALSALAARSAVPALIEAEPLPRLDPAAESAAYFVVAEALTNVAKHSQATSCQIGLRLSGGALRVWVTDDGAGGAAVAKGHGLRGLEDRLHALGGRLEVASPRGGPTTVAAELPCP
jgi:signal transduction histidine kinase